MEEKFFFFTLDGETRKVSVPFLDSVSDLVPLLTSKFPDSKICQQPQFWTRDEKYGVNFQITTPEDIPNGAVLWVVNKEKSAEPKSTELSAKEPYRFEGVGGVNSAEPGASGSSGLNAAFYGGPNHVGTYGLSGFPQEPLRRDVEICDTHQKRRTVQNLTQQEDGTWVCKADSECKTESSFTVGGEEQICSRHGKSRTVQNLQQGDDGEWVCLRSSRCKTANSGGSRRRRGYGGGYGQFPRPSGYGGGFGPFRGFRGGFPRGPGCGYGSRGGFGARQQRGRFQCSVHGKTRTEANLRSDGSGGWQCLPTSECK